MVPIVLAPLSAKWVALGVVLLAAGSGGFDFALVVGSGIAITWLAMYFLGAVGLACSARSNSSWRSLLATLVFGYAGGTVLGCVGLPIGCIGTVIFSSVFAAIRHRIMGYDADPTLFGGGLWTEFILMATMPLGSALLMWLIARSILISAENTIAKRDRIPPEWVRMIEFDLGRHDRPRSYRRYRG